MAVSDSDKKSRSLGDRKFAMFYPSPSHVLVQATSAAYQTFPETRAGPAVLVMAVSVRILMTIVVFGEFADVQRMPRPVRTSQQSGCGELMTGRSAVNFQQRFRASFNSSSVSLFFDSRTKRTTASRSRIVPLSRGYRRQFGVVPAIVSRFSYRQRLSTFRINVPLHCDP